MPDGLTTDLITGQTQEDIERTMRDGFIAIRDEAGHLLMRYHPAKNLIEIQRRGIKTTINFRQYQQRSDMSAEEELKQLKIALMKRFIKTGSPVTLEDMTLDFCIELLDDVSMDYVRLKSATSATVTGGDDGRLPNN